MAQKKPPRRRRGESILETLIALAIASVSFVMLANMIDISTVLIGRGERSMTRYLNAESELNFQSDGTGAYGSDKVWTSDGAVWFALGDTMVFPGADARTDQRVRISAKPYKDSTDKTYKVQYYVNDVLAQTEVQDDGTAGKRRETVVVSYRYVN